MSHNEYDPPQLQDMTQEEVDAMTPENVLHLVASDYDRRRQGWWGRFLLWLLRKTT